MFQCFSLRSASSIISTQVHMFAINMPTIIIYITISWEKYAPNVASTNILVHDVMIILHYITRHLTLHYIISSYTAFIILYLLFGKAFKKQTKRSEDQGRKQVTALQSLNSSQQLKWINDLFQKFLLHNEVNSEKDKIKKIEQWIIRDDLNYKRGNKNR